MKELLFQFRTKGPYGPPPLKNGIFKNLLFFHVTRDPKRDIEPNFHMPAPLKNGNFEEPFFCYATRGQKRDIKPNFHDHTTSGG